MGKRFYWLKLPEDFFRQKEIKKLRQIAGGDTYTIIYLKLLLESLKTGGKLYYEGVEENFPSEMALQIDEDEENVNVTVKYLAGRGILQQNTSDEFEIVTASEMTGSEGESAARMRKFRDTKTSQCDALPSPSDDHVTAMFGEIEKKREKQIGEKSASRKSFIPPPREEVRAYCRERNSPVDPDAFFEFFSAGDWIDSKGNQVRSWKQRVITWERFEKVKTPAQEVRAGSFRSNSLVDTDLIEDPPGSGRYLPRSETLS